MNYEQAKGFAMHHTQPRNFHTYFNEPPRTDKNVCGQAAVAAMLDYHGNSKLGNVDKTERDEVYGTARWPNAQAVNAVSTVHPPDYLFGFLGTRPGQIVTALRYWGLWASVVRPSGWDDIAEWVDDGLPVITAVNRSRLGSRLDPDKPVNRIINKIPIVHWAIIYRIENSRVYVANTNLHTSNTRHYVQVHKDRYMRGMNEWWMAPLGFRNCAIFVAPDAPQSIIENTRSASRFHR